MCFPTPGGDVVGNDGSADDRPLRYDLDDLNGEIVLLDWGGEGGDASPEVSVPNRDLPSYKLMNGKVSFVRILEGKTEIEIDRHLHHKMTLISPRDHEFMRPLPPDYDDPIAQDIRDIPRCV